MANAQHLEDRAYLLQAMAAAHAQVEINTLAVEKAQDKSVRDFATVLLKDYKGRYDRAVALAEARGMDAFAGLEPAEAYLMDVMRSLDGAAFDAAYLAGEVPPLYTEEWVNRRTARHATEAPIRKAAAAAVEPIHAHYARALDLALLHEDDLPDDLVHPWDSTALVFGMNVDMAQVALGNLIIEKVGDEEVKVFAERMVEEHAASLDATKKLAEARGIEPLDAPGPLEVGLLSLLSTLSPEDLALPYVQSQVIFHDNWYKRTEFTGNNGRDEEVKAFTHQGHTVGMAHHDAVYQVLLGLDG